MNNNEKFKELFSALPTETELCPKKLGTNCGKPLTSWPGINAKSVGQGPKLWKPQSLGF